MRCTDDGPAAGLVEWRAGHAGAGFDRDIAECRALAEDRRGPHYLAHSTYGIRDFAVGTPDCWPATATATDFEDIGSPMNLAFTQLDEACAPLDTGPLIRLVAQGSAGTLFEFSKVPGQNFFGLAFGGGDDTSRHADQVLAGLARASVERLGGTGLDWGGFRERDASGDLWIPYEARPDSASGPPPGAVVTVATSSVPRPVTELCLSALAPGDLHSVGFCLRDQLIWAADIFELPELGPFFQRVSPDFRRRGYARLAHHVRLQFPRFRRLLELTGGTDVDRLVIDVARGAVYGLPVTSGVTLVGVTLLQSRVDRTDQKLRRLQSAVLSAWPASDLRPVS